jgi:hypothetical protein
MESPLQSLDVLLSAKKNSFAHCRNNKEWGETLEL